MNCSYRSLWNDRTGTFVAVSENACSQGKKVSCGITASGAGIRFALQTLAWSVALSFATQVQALPVGGVVAAGSANISTGPANTTITQTSQNTVINWQSFNIAQGQSVQFVQPNAQAVALNRVLGADPSSIFGTLSANGKVFLVNPNGVLFGKGSSVNVGGLLASTLNITNSDFLAGNYQFSGAGTGAVLNQGTLNADSGYVALLGANVSNQGVISAQLGSVVLAAGNAMTLDVAGDGLLNIAVNEGAVNALVQNGGLIRADGGQVLLTTQAAGSLLNNAVNNTGVIQAQTLVTGKSGSIKLMGGMQSGTVNVGGRLDASAPNGGNGGFIETSAAHVKVADNVTITSQAAQGTAGTWLIDPVDFTVAAGADIAGTTLSALLVTTSVNINTAVGVDTTVAGAPPVNTLYSSTPGLGNINVNEAVTWTASLTATTLTLNAFNDVNIQAPITATTGSLTSIAGRDVNLNAAITTTTGNITSNAGRDINVNAATTTTTGDFIACCGRDININANMTTTSGNVLLRAGSDGSGNGVAGVGGTVTFAPGITYTVTSAAPNTVVVDYTPTSYATPHDYSGNFTGTGAALLTQHMLVFAQGVNKVYDGNTSATLALKGTPSLGGVVTLIPGTATFDSKDVAANIGITYTGYSLGGVDAGLFALWMSCVPGIERTSAAITPRPMSILADSASKVYGQTFTPASNAFTTPVAPIAGETVLSVTETSTGSAAGASVAGSTYPIIPSAALANGTFLPSNYTISYLNGALTVTPAPLTVTANDASKTYGQTTVLPPTAFTSTGLVNGDTVTAVTEVSPGTVPTAPVAGSPYVITPSGATGTYVPSNYTVAYINGALTIIPAPLVVTANDASKTYGQTTVLPTTAFTSTGLVNGDTVTAVTEVSPGTVPTAPVAGSPYVITPSGATGTYVPSNYTVAYINGALTIIPAALVVTANDASKTYGQTTVLPPTAFTSTGLVNGDTVTAVTEVSPGTVPTAPVAGSPYVITPSGATGTYVLSNYTVAYVNGALTIIPAPLVVTANDASKTYGQTTVLPPTAFTSTGLVNGDTVTAVTEVSPGTVPTAPVAGSPYVITPSGATGTYVPSNYTVAYINGALTIIPAPMTVTANDASKTYGQTTVLPTTAFTSTGLVNGDTVTAVTEVSPGTVATAPVAGSPYVITPSGATGTYVPSNYTVAYINGALTIIPAALAVTANDASKTYGQTIVLPTTAFTSTGLVNGDTVTAVNETSPGTVPTAPVAGSPYVITPSGATGTYVPGNYTVKYVNGVLTVIPAVELPVVVPPVNPPPVTIPPNVVPPVIVTPPVAPPPVFIPPPVIVPPTVVPPPVVTPPQFIPPAVVPPVIVSVQTPLVSDVAPTRTRKQDRN